MIGIITGLTAEARIARRLGIVAAGGGTVSGAVAAAELLIAQGATSLVSFGFAGGLDPALRPGSLIIPAKIVGGGATDPALTRWLGGPTGTLYAGREIAVTTAEKFRLHAMTGASAIDLESEAVARIAAARALPFAALRAICDPADTDLPPAAIFALEPNGAIGLARVIASVLRHPAQLPSLLRLAAHAAAARRSLQRQVRRILQAKAE
jgi:adenosylhomocysteine nucleosidase